MCKPHRCPHIAMTGNICVYCPGGPDSDFEYSTQSYTGYEVSNAPLSLSTAFPRNKHDKRQNRSFCSNGVGFLGHIRIEFLPHRSTGRGEKKLLSSLAHIHASYSSTIQSISPNQASTGTSNCFSFTNERIDGHPSPS